MDKPKCRLCGDRHRLGSTCPRFETVPKAERIKAVTHAVILTASQQSNAESNKPAVESNKRIPREVGENPAPSFDRTAYEREYMRRWRRDHPKGGVA
jgi:hypothetical protein